MAERMKQAVRAYMDWLRMGPEDRSGLGECPVEDRLAPLGLSMQQHEKALRHAMTKLMKKGYVIRMLDGWPQAIPFDDVPEEHREEIIRRRRNPSEDDIVARHGGVGISFLSVSDEEAEKYYGPPPDKSKTDEQAARPAIFVEIDCRNLDVEATVRQLVANGIPEWQARQIVVELQQRMKASGKHEARP